VLAGASAALAVALGARAAERSVRREAGLDSRIPFEAVQNLSAATLKQDGRGATEIARVMGVGRASVYRLLAAA